MSDELGAALRELAAQHETPPRLAAAEIRGRATRRSRRRKAALALGTAATAACVLAAVTHTLHTGDATGTRHLPGAASDAPPPGPATPDPRTTSSGVLDLGRHTLTIGDRVMRVDSHSFGRFPAGTRLTVRAKTEMDLLPLEGRPESGTEVKVPYLVELRTPGQQPVYAGGLAFDTKALMALSADSGWVGMSVTDAEWFYRRVRVGDGIDLRSTPVPSADVTTALPGTSGE
ncbi:hypothetical protein ACF052_15425 [Streptomyces pilosus]|uniref:hypothetical protein n=1 Tax=Streptomyces pilosus TaxID=28893 RepID=UPI003702385C